MCKDKDCEYCGGSELIECDDCMGSGLLNPNDEFDLTECDQCGGLGEIECPECS